MNHYGVILRKLRELKRLPLKQAAKRIERSAGWLSEIENGKGAARIPTFRYATQSCTLLKRAGLVDGR
jgi:transcriptional regulator with XRE-family HTH domain